MRRRRLLAAAVIVVALLVASPWPARWLIRERPLERPDAILSLTSHERERFAETAAQAKRWPQAVVLLAMPDVVGKYNCDACSHRVGWLETLGVPRARIRMLTPRVRNTDDELVTAAKWMRERRLTRLLIVTSPYHTRRVQVLARADLSGVQVGVVACPVAGGLRKLWWTRHYDRSYVIYEFAALAAAWWRLNGYPGSARRAVGESSAPGDGPVARRVLALLCVEAVGSSRFAKRGSAGLTSARAPASDAPRPSVIRRARPWLAPRPPAARCCGCRSRGRRQRTKPGP